MTSKRQQLEEKVFLALGQAAQIQQAPHLPTIGPVLQEFKGQYSEADIVSIIEYFELQGDIQLLKAMGSPERWSFRFSPQGKRKLDLQTE